MTSGVACYVIIYSLFTVSYSLFTKSKKPAGGRFLQHETRCEGTKKPTLSSGLMLALPIFPASRPASIVGASELNFCVRDGNRWTLTAINTNCYQVSLKTTLLYYSFFICQVVFFISAHHKQHNEVVASGNDEQCHTLSNAACRIAIL